MEVSAPMGIWTLAGLLEQLMFNLPANREVTVF